MRYRASVPLKGAPKHRNSLPFTEAEVQHTAEVLAAWTSTDRLVGAGSVVQQAWLVEARHGSASCTDRLLREAALPEIGA